MRPSLASAVRFAAFLLTCTATLHAQSPLQTVPVASGLTSPDFATAPAGDFNRLFLVELGMVGNSPSTSGNVRLLDLSQSPPVLLPTPYLAISPIATLGEGGLLGLAFHPDFANNGYFYVCYTHAGLHVARYQANAPYMSSTGANPASATPVLTIPNMLGSHNGGWIGFGPDHLLYIAIGDSGDRSRPQNLQVLEGKLLRIDVDGDDFPADPARNYAIPPSNPYHGSTTALPEIWACGLRNPWRTSIDRLTGEVWIGDVGEGGSEEIDRIPAGVGGLNFGWPCMEGFNCTGYAGCVCNDPALTLPAYTYPHLTNAASVMGGYRYRGSALCGFQGTYFFGDWSNGLFFSFQWDGTSIQNFTDRTAELGPGFLNGRPVSFGEDAAGELYAISLSGHVSKIVPGTITDCNGNGIHDGCDIAGGTSEDRNANGVPDECEPLGVAGCFGDGSTPSACPCGNTGALRRGCDNSAATGGARLEAVGLPANDDVALLSSGELPSVLTIFLQGSANHANGLVFGDGVRCAAGVLKRLYAKSASGGVAQAPGAGDPSISARSAQLGDPLLPLSGQLRYYQAYYRDPDASFCPAPAGGNWNVSSLLAIAW